jgi:hypothetical protein
MNRVEFKYGQERNAEKYPAGIICDIEIVELCDTLHYKNSSYVLQNGSS